MKKKTLSGVYSGGYTLSASYDQLIITRSAGIGGAVGAAGAYGRTQGQAGGAGGTALTIALAATIKNSGTVVGGVGGNGGDTFYSYAGAGGMGGEGVVLVGAAEFSNRGGAIIGGQGGIGGRPGSDPHNSYGLSGAGGTAIFLGNGANLNNISGTITGGAAGTTQNSGQGEGQTGGDGGNGVDTAVAALVANSGVVTGGAAGAGFAGVYQGGTGGAGGAGMYAEGSVRLVNTGVLSGGAGGVGGLTFDGFDTGGAGGAGGAGAVLDGEGSVSNTGLISGGTGGDGGVADNGGSQGAAGLQGDGVALTGACTLTNGGPNSATARIIGAVGVVVDGDGAATVVNFGTITGTSGVSVQLGGTADRLVVEAGSTFGGAVAGGGGTLELAKASGTITGVGGGNGAVSGAEALAFGGFGGFAIDAGGSWTLSGALVGAVDNAGLIVSTGATGALQGGVTNDGVLETSGTKAVLTVTGAVSGTGSAVIGGGRLDFASAFSENVKFTGASGVLELAQSQGYGGTISGFSTSGGTQLDLLDIAFAKKGTTATFSGGANGGVLTVTDGSHTADIKLKGDYLGATFAVSTDKQGGTLVTDTIANAPSVHAFASAMAGMIRVGDAALVTGAASGHGPGQTLLARPAA